MGLLDWLFGKSQKTTLPELDDAPPEAQQEYSSPEISPPEVKQKLDAGESVILLDVRQPEELDICRIEGAMHIPMMDVHERYKEISDEPNAEIIVFCHHGSRSMQVMHQLWGLGYQNAKNMSGGIHAWSLDVDPKVPRY
ncbi:MAG: rhodanese-like domain-containing protein [Candidatus Hinthialibacter antarcticus]|nr:rhodanese-like domain-containing protein [Candidatus Hinthialibacter antarcticus]